MTYGDPADDFYSRASYEARPVIAAMNSSQKNFYSRASYEARLSENMTSADMIDFYSRASYEARLGCPKKWTPF